MPEMTATSKTKQSDASYKETVESILVAFILAFIFRAFVVEAFVIPTGSMAPTLYGAHMRMTCPDCGYTFDVGYQSPRTESGEEGDIRDEIDRPSNIHCPNCGYDFPSRDAMKDPIKQPIRFGDRILVLKYLYLFKNPSRWDVVVFKSPFEERHVAEDPEYSVNYIKRLVGNPTESIVILDGNVYVGPSGAKGVERTDETFKVAADADQFQIQRKPLYVQERLWRSVYDNDFIPRGQPASRSNSWHQPWQSSDGTGWNLGDGGTSRVFRFNNADSASTLFFNPTANRELNYLTDWIAYDQSGSRDRPWVPDLKLRCFYTRKSGDGALRLYLTNSEHCFVAEVTPGKVSLYASTVVSPSDETSGKGFEAGPMTLIESKSLPELANGVPTQIEFLNYDYQVILRINGKNVLAKPYEYQPNVRELWERALNNRRDPLARPEVRISAEKQTCSIDHLALWHDIYYGNESHDSRLTFWASPEKVMHLGPREYFVLGDNSLISGDARYWQQPVHLPHEGLPDVEGGRVPESFMLGKAFFVYWPAGYRMPYVPLNTVPDFGEMRFIR